MGRHSLRHRPQPRVSQVGKHRAVRPKTNYGRRVLIASSAAMAMALYPVALGDGTGSLPIYEFNEVDIPLEARPAEIVARGEVTTEPTEEPKENDEDLPVDE